MTAPSSKVRISEAAANRLEALALELRLADTTLLAAIADALIEGSIDAEAVAAWLEPSKARITRSRR